MSCNKPKHRHAKVPLKTQFNLVLRFFSGFKLAEVRQFTMQTKKEMVSEKEMKMTEKRFIVFSRDWTIIYEHKENKHISWSLKLSFTLSHLYHLLFLNFGNMSGIHLIAKFRGKPKTKKKKTQSKLTSIKSLVKSKWFFFITSKVFACNSVCILFICLQC